MQKHDSTNYQIKDFINHSDKHLAVIITRKWMQRNLYRVYSPFSIEDRHGERHHFENNFISDGGTIPWYLWLILRYNGPAMAAFLIHDLWCAMANKCGEYWPRKVGDGGIFNNLIDCTINEKIARIASSAVKRYGEILHKKGVLK